MQGAPFESFSIDFKRCATSLDLEGLEDPLDRHMRESFKISADCREKAVGFALT
jgi:hypothetical protein